MNKKPAVFTTLRLLEMVEADAKAYRLRANESILRNKHMNEATGTKLDQRDIDALLCDFINFMASGRGVDFGLYTHYLTHDSKTTEVP
jgi:hypothetical protein